MADQPERSDRHVDPKLTIRPPAEMRREVLRILRERGLTAQDYVLACLAALVDDPDWQIKVVEPHWPPPKPKGRPPKRDTGGHGRDERTR